MEFITLAEYWKDNPVFDEEKELYDLLADCYIQPRVERQRINKMKVPLTRVSLNLEGVEWFNRIYSIVTGKSNVKAWRKITETESGSISKKRENFSLPMFGVESCSSSHGRKKGTSASIVLDLLTWWGQFRILLGAANAEEEGKVYGREAFDTFCDELKKDGINIESYAITNGWEVKQSIKWPPVGLAQQRFRNHVFECAHHIDLNSSYVSGIAEAFPEMRPAIQRIYDRRKEDKKFKSVLTNTTGYFQCQWCRINGNMCALANLSKTAIDFNNAYIEDLTNELLISGRTVIAYNTDGIWYEGDIYHDETEGTDLGQWKNDHVNCQLRFKSGGAYEFIEDGVYHPVLRGSCNYDKIKSDRSTWEWGDIYRKDTEPIKWKFDEDLGIIPEGE